MRVRAVIILFFLSLNTLLSQHNDDSLNKTFKEFYQKSSTFKNISIDSVIFNYPILKHHNDSFNNCSDTLFLLKFSSDLSYDTKVKDRLIRIYFHRGSSGFGIKQFDKEKNSCKVYESGCFECGHYAYTNALRFAHIKDKVIVYGIEANWKYFFVFDSNLELVESFKYWYRNK